MVVAMLSLLVLLGHHGTSLEACTVSVYGALCMCSVGEIFRAEEETEEAACGEMYVEKGMWRKVCGEMYVYGKCASASEVVRILCQEC